MPHSRKIAMGVGAAALTAGVSLGVSGMASATTTPTPSSSSPSSSSSSTTTGEAERGFGGHGGRGGQVVAFELAAKLGVDEAAVTEALQSVREANRTAAEESGERPDREAMQSAMAASLAEALGIDEAQVQTALDELRAEQQAERAAALQERLDAAVQDGSLTQAEADGAARAVELGIIGGGR